MSQSRYPSRDRDVKRALSRRDRVPGRTVAAPAKDVPAAPVQIASDQNALLCMPRVVLFAAVGVVLVSFLWAYWPTWRALVHAWNTEPDYSHGYFVLPFAAYFLWARRQQFPGVSRRHWLWPGVLLLAAGTGLRYAAAKYYLEPVDGWSMLFWVTGIVWLVGGWAWVRWWLPSIAFLLFMIPLPFRIERLLSYPLQRVAATISGWMLQCFGLPAVVQGNTILVGSQTLEVEQACSGLTIFVGVAALAFAYVVLVHRSWWEKVLLIGAVLPIAIISNSVRVLLTGLLYEYVSSAAAKKFSHDLAGMLMLPFAAALFGATLLYLGWLFPTAEQLGMRGMIRAQRRSLADGRAPAARHV